MTLRIDEAALPRPTMKAFTLMCANCKQLQTWLLPDGDGLPRCFECGCDELHELIERARKAGK
jgi:hypothetical protein